MALGSYDGDHHCFMHPGHDLWVIIMRYSASLVVITYPTLVVVIVITLIVQGNTKDGGHPC